MFNLKYATNDDEAFWFTLDKHLNVKQFYKKLKDNQCYVIFDDNIPVGVMRYNLFWDNIPFMNLIYFHDKYQGNGFGKKAMKHWEDEMKLLGYKMVMTSTQSDESAQHFYRKLGYKDCGCLIIDIPEFEQPAEIFFAKSI